MRKVSSYKCPECGMRFKSLSAWGDHLDRIHNGTVPKGYSYARYFYYCTTGKTAGSCVQCHKPTEWNETTGKYSRYCSDPKCKQAYVKTAKKRMVDKYGKSHLLNDPNKQREMLDARSSVYRFRDGGTVKFLSSYERDFLMTAEFTLGLKSKDIIGPSPNTYVYMYEGKEHFYIPDFFIHDLNLEIEIKDGGDDPNNHPHMQIDRAKERLKDEMMIKNPSVNYFKVVDKKYDDFYKFLLDCKLAIDDDVKAKLVEQLAAVESTGQGEILYHGSNGKHRILKAQISPAYPTMKAVYASPSYEFALAYCGLPWDDLQINQSFYNGKHVLTEITEGAFDKVFNCPGYIHCLESTDFRKFRSNEYTCPHDVRPYSITKIDNVMRAIEKSNTTLYRYPDLPPFIRDREEYNRDKRALYGIGEPALESGIYDVSFKDPKEAYDVIKKRVKYTEFTKLLTPAQTFEHGKGSCHDQAKLAYAFLMRSGVTPKLNFFISYREGDEVGGDTHTFVTYKKGNSIYWFETAWEGECGIHEYPSIEALRASILERHRKTSNGKKYPELEFTTVSPEKLKPGMKLDEYVNACLGKTANEQASDEPWKDAEYHAFYKLKHDEWEKNFNRCKHLYEREKIEYNHQYADRMRKERMDEFNEIWKKKEEEFIRRKKIEYWSKPANESALTASERTDFGLPDLKKYPMPDEKHVLLAIQYFNHVDEDRERELAENIIKRMKELKIAHVNVGEKNRFAKYYKPTEDSVMTDWCASEPGMGLVAMESGRGDGFYTPIRLNSNQWCTYRGKKYYPLYIILLRNISPLGSVIRAYTKEDFSHSSLSFDPSMQDCYTFGNKLLKEGKMSRRSFGTAHESFDGKSGRFSYPSNTVYHIYVMFFDEKQIKAVRNTVDNIFTHHSDYQYNIEGLFSYIFNKPKTDPNKLFCSQFVSLVINSGKPGILTKDPSMYTPVGLTTLRGVFDVEEGTIGTYDKTTVEKRTKRIFEKIIETENFAALEHTNLLYNADWEDSDNINISGGFYFPEE